MFRTTLFLAGILVFCFAGCASDGDKCCGTCDSTCDAAEQAALYTTTKGIFVDGALTGYLVVYDEIPEGEDLEPIAPAGTTFIQNLDFKNVGFITPTGKLFRFGETGTPVKLYQDRLEDNLAVFYGVDKGKIAVRDS